MLSDSGHISRRNFLKAITVLGLSSCTPFLPRTRFIHLLTNDPHPDHYNPILRSLIKLVLPFEHPRFPEITPDTVLKNIDIHFPLTEERQEPFQRAFVLFNDIQLFNERLPAIIDEEAKLFREFEGFEKSEINSRIDEFVHHDQLLFNDFEKKHGYFESFMNAPKEVQSDYFYLWSQSSFNIRRMFFNSAKGVINACTYCHEDMWEVMGYDGHFDPMENQ